MARVVAIVLAAGCCGFLGGGCGHPGRDSVVAGTGSLGAPSADLRRPLARSWFGPSPVLDGVLSPGEWTGATEITGVADWVPEFSAVRDPADLSLRAWVQHDRHRLHFAFEVTDNHLYGVTTPRWLPRENPRAHELSREGFPWFGDGLEILMDARPHRSGPAGVDGSGESWQMVCNATKSRLGGVGTGGLLEGEPRSSATAWETYGRWIHAGDQQAAVRLRPDGRGYTVEWSVSFDPCLEVAPGRCYSPESGEVVVGLNLAVGDLDRSSDGAGNFGGFHHEQWWAGARHTRTQRDNFGSLRLMGLARRPPVGVGR
jgi:SSS family solute:Na+ symporter